MTYNFEIKKAYSFELYSNTMFETEFKNVTVMGILDFSLANQFADLYPQHVQIYPSLPSGTPNNPRAYSFLLLSTVNNDQMVVGIPWIKTNTIIEIQSNTIEILVDSVGVQDIPLITNALLKNGYENISVRMLD